MFKAEEIADCQECFGTEEGDSLSELFFNRLGYGLSKPRLLRILFGYVISQRESEFDGNGKGKRSVIQVLQKIIELATINYQPVTLDIWRKNQESGYFGNLLE